MPAYLYCRKCGRRLKTAESQALGIGPVCGGHGKGGKGHKKAALDSLTTDIFDMTQTYFATISSTQAFNGNSGPGYVEIQAGNEGEARLLIAQATSNRWAFMYHALDDVHPLDRIKLGELP